MGIKNFSQLLRWKAPDVKTIINIKELKGKKLAVDAHLIIYSSIMAIRNSGKDFTNKSGKITSHLIVFIYRIRLMLYHGIVPIFIYDGALDDFKLVEAKKRRNAKKKLLEKMEHCSEEERTKLFKRTYSICEDDIKSSRQLLNNLGIPWMEAPGEADILCAYLSKKNLVYGVVSDDSDILIYGAKRLYPQFFTFLKQNKAVEIKLSSLLKQLNFNMEQLVELCILLGCPYYNPPRGFGLKTAFKKLTEVGSLKELVDDDLAIKVKNHYLKAADKIKMKIRTLYLRKLKKKNLIEFLEKNDFKFIDKIIKSLEKVYNLYDKNT